MAELEPAIKAIAGQVERGEDLAGALVALDTILARAPDHPEALQLAGAVAFRVDDFAAAEAYFRRAAVARPNDAGARNNLGQALRAQTKTGAARTAFLRALGLDPVFAEPAMNLGLMAAAEGDWRGAIGFYAQALNRRTNYAEAHFNWAIALERLGQPGGAIGHYWRAVQFRPAYVRAINNLAVLLDEDGRLGEAEAWFRAGLDAAPDAAELWSGLGSNQRAQGNLDVARDAYHRALALRPDFPECRWNLALVQLAEADFGEGWSNYRYRPSAERWRTRLPEAPWAPDGWPGKAQILGEQGLGDEIFFLRFARELGERGTEIRYAPDPKLRAILGRLDFVEVVPADQAGDWISVADLPYLMGAGSAPSTIRLEPDPAHLAAMGARLAAAGPRPYLGLTWRAGIKQPGSLYKEIPIAELAAAVQEWPGTLISLQREAGAEERGLLVADFTGCNDNLEDMLALMVLIDRVAGVSNTNMHLRAAVGGNADILVTHPAEYRWMAAADRSPWFPDFALHRQAADGAWAAAFDGLRRGLL